MKQFKNLEVTCPVEKQLAFVNAISANLPDHWHRDHDAESRLEEVDGASKDSWFAFTYEAKDGEPASRVSLVRENKRLYVSNIVPLEFGQLSIDQYNRILDKFEDILRSHESTDSALSINVTSDKANINDWVSTSAGKLLERFSVCANMSTGSSHPNDFQRWVDFLIVVHKEGSSLSSEFLGQWLNEELGWPSDKARELASEYEFARDILRAYDQSI